MGKLIFVHGCIVFVFWKQGEFLTVFFSATLEKSTFLHDQASAVSKLPSIIYPDERERKGRGGLGGNPQHIFKACCQG